MCGRKQPDNRRSNWLTAAGIIVEVAGAVCRGRAVAQLPYRRSAGWKRQPLYCGQAQQPDSQDHGSHWDDCHRSWRWIHQSGTGGGGYSGDNGPATLAELNFPQGVTVDINGNLFIADTENNRIRRVDAVTGDITTAVGNGTAGATGDTGLATAGELNEPFTVAFDSNGNMYIPDSTNNKIREVSAVNGLITAASVITTAVGTGGAVDGCANGPTSGAGLRSPSGVAVDPAGNIYISDHGQSVRAQDKCCERRDQIHRR